MLSIKNKNLHNYEIIKQYEAGMILKGIYVKCIRNNRVNITGSFISILSNQAILRNIKINNTTIDVSLLLHQRQINKLLNFNHKKNTTIVPMRIYAGKRYIKLEIAAVESLTKRDKREKIKERDMRRQNLY